MATDNAKRERDARGEIVQIKKERITVRIDKDVIVWLKSSGPGYQTRMNAILRAAMEDWN